MKTNFPADSLQRYSTAIPAPKASIQAEVKQYYKIAGPDYVTWSKHFNMHFGYCSRFTDIFSLEKMLVNMNEEVMKELKIVAGKYVRIADLGCGMGTVARQIARKFPNATLSAFTIIDHQVSHGKLLTEKAGLSQQVKMIKGDFEALDVPGDHFDHAYALESACHSSGKSKEPFISELSRILKRGGRFCIADGFIKNNSAKPRLFVWLYKRIAKYWAVPGFACIHDFEEKLRESGLKQIKVREISHRIAPSVLYVPLICAKFFFREIIRNRSLRMKKERWYNVYAPLLGMLMGLYRKHFGYYIISGGK